MTEEHPTLNDDTDDIGIGSSPADRPQGTSDDMISTLDDKEVAPSSEGEAKTEEQEVKKDTDDKVTADLKAADEVKPRPYHEDPAWQRIIKERDETKAELAKLQGQIDLLTKMTPAEKKEAEKLPYVDITAMEDDELRDWQQNDPKGYAANLYAQITYEQEQERAQKETERQRAQAVTQTQERFKKEVDSYSKEHEDFLPMWNSGEILKFMSDHPGLYNAVTAHQAMTLTKTRAEMDAKYQADLEAAIKAKEEELIKAHRTKSNVRVLGEGPSTGPSDDPNAELNDIKRGDEIGTLVERLKRLRQATG